MKYFRRSPRRSYRRINRRKLKRRLAARKFLRKYNLPNTVKYLGMSQMKHRVLRTSYNVFDNDNNPPADVPATFQIILDPMCSNEMKDMYSETDINKTPHSLFFKYDYMKIKRICVSIRPVSNKPNDNANQTVKGNNLTGYIDQNVYAYFTYKFPTYAGQVEADMTKAYSLYPERANCQLEAKYKELYSWNYAKPMLFTFRKLKYVSSLNIDKVNPNGLINLQYIRHVVQVPAVSIFGNDRMNLSVFESTNKENNDDEIEIENKEEEEDNTYDEDRQIVVVGTNIELPSISDVSAAINFGRLVLFFNSSYKFNVEILYDAYFYR